MIGWDDIRHFEPREFDSPDDPGSGEEHMQMQFVNTLDSIREQVGFPLVVNSGYRTPEHNEKVGGADSSAHVRGWAADLDIPENSSRKRFLMIRVGMDWGIHRFGVGEHYIHMDMDPKKDPRVMWLYT